LKTLSEVIAAVKQTAMSIEQLRAQVMRWQRAPKYGPGGGGSEVCKRNWLVYINANAQPSSGSFTMTLTVNTAGETTSDVAITVNYDDGFPDIQTALEAEDDMLDSDDELIVALTGGPIRLSGIGIRNLSATAPKVQSISLSNNTLNNGIPYILPFN
jgi:hypothetical protein